MNKPSVGFEAEYRDWTTYAQRVIRVNSSPYLYVLKTGQLHFRLGDTVHKLTPDSVCWWPSGSQHVSKTEELKPKDTSYASPFRLCNTSPG